MARANAKRPFRRQLNRKIKKPECNVRQFVLAFRDEATVDIEWKSVVVAVRTDVGNRSLEML
jgi:hypothetical protein